LSVDLAHLRRPMVIRWLFWPSGRPRRALRKLLFDRDGRPRPAFRALVVRKKGTPRAAFERWMGSAEYRAMPWARSKVAGAVGDAASLEVGDHPLRQGLIDRLAVGTDAA
jgi:hypothetical protein